MTLERARFAGDQVRFWTVVQARWNVIVEFLVCGSFVVQGLFRGGTPGKLAGIEIVIIIGFAIMSGVFLCVGVVIYRMHFAVSFDFGGRVVTIFDRMRGWNGKEAAGGFELIEHVEFQEPLGYVEGMTVFWSDPAREPTQIALINDCTPEQIGEFRAWLATAGVAGA